AAPSQSHKHATATQRPIPHQAIRWRRFFLRAAITIHPRTPPTNLDHDSPPESPDSSLSLAFAGSATIALDVADREMYWAHPAEMPSVPVPAPAREKPAAADRLIVHP